MNTNDYEVLPNLPDDKKRLVFLAFDYFKQENGNVIADFMNLAIIQKYTVKKEQNTKIKEETLQEKNIIYSQGFFRYVNYEWKLLTTGFKTREALRDYTNTFRFDNVTIPIMQDRFDIQNIKKEQKNV